MREIFEFGFELKKLFFTSSLFFYKDLELGFKIDASLYHIVLTVNLFFFEYDISFGIIRDYNGNDYCDFNPNNN